MLGRGNKATAPWKKGTLKKSGQKKKITIRTGGIIQGSIKLDPPPNAEIKWYDQAEYQPSTMYHHQSCTCSRKDL